MNGMCPTFSDTDAVRFKEDLRHFALEHGADMLGFAHISRFDDAPAEFHPRNIYPAVRTVVVIGVRVLRGLAESLDAGQLIPYNAFGYGGINMLHMRTALQQTACRLEDSGFSAIPVIQWTGTPHQEPIICHRTAAVAAGLGELGWSKVFLTKRFGPLQRLGVILTDADLPSDPLQLGQICDGCMACVRGCPGQAISQHEAVEFKIDGQVVRHAKVDMYRCTRAHHGSIQQTHPGRPAEFDIADIDEKYAAMARDARDDTEAYVLGHQARSEVIDRYNHPLFSLVGSLGLSCAFCGAQGCFRACLEHLEKRGRLDHRFANTYRQSPAVNVPDQHLPAGATRSAAGREVNIE
ncbi:MAG TPA: hypothetical protein PLP01_03035 [Phycisphaerae bacterium]|nr:epoxyqueuosine reductase [Phycisphaerae bacterium]HOI54201.1 hypothetical protein [Phycisphaerae bacterium]